METKLNLRGMIHLDQIEDLLSNLIDTVDRQQEDIKRLQSICDGFMTNQAADEKFQIVHRGMEDMTAKISHVHMATTARLEGKE